MAQRQTAPSESDLLCEQCGYLLNGLPDSVLVCPECGTPVAESLDPTRRQPAPIEREWTRAAFLKTSLATIADKRRFYRGVITRRDSPNVARFGRWHRTIAGLLLAGAATLHAIWLGDVTGLDWQGWLPAFAIASFAAMAVILPFALAALTRLATWLTYQESKWWGMRLPTPVVRRAMNFHAANYLPVAIVGFAITAGYRLLLATRVLSPSTGVPYLVVLCSAVVLSAFWLFESYVVAMRRIRLANF